MSGPVTLFYGELRAERFFFAPEDSHHLVRVLRCRNGEVIWATNGSGTVFEVRLEEARPRASEGVVISAWPEYNELSTRIGLIQGRMLPTRMDWLVEKATELGVAQIVPLEGRPPVGQGRVRRWQRLARSASKQCLRGRIPRVEEPLSLEAAIAGTPTGAHRLLADPRGSLELPADLGGKEIVLAVGPDAGFSDTELTQLWDAGFAPVGLGRRRLRAETAALTLIGRVAASLEASRNSGLMTGPGDEIA